MPVVRSVVREARRHDYRFTSIVLGIVQSAPFQMRTARESVPAGSPVARATGN
jgi:hypothetical protein